MSTGKSRSQVSRLVFIRKWRHTILDNIRNLYPNVTLFNTKARFLSSQNHWYPARILRHLRAKDIYKQSTELRKNNYYTKLKLSFIPLLSNISFKSWRSRKKHYVQSRNLELSSNFLLCSTWSQFPHCLVDHPLADLHDGIYRWPLLHVGHRTALGNVSFCNIKCGNLWESLLFANVQRLRWRLSNIRIVRIYS